MVKTEVKTDAKHEMRIEQVDRPTGGTYVKDRAVAERMLAGATRHLNRMGELQKDARVHGIKLTKASTKGVIRRAKRQQRRKAFKGSEGFEASARLTRTAPPLSEKAEARKRAREFNQKYAGGVDGSGNAGTDTGAKAGIAVL